MPMGPKPKFPLYQLLARFYDSWDRCGQPDANESMRSFMPKHEETIRRLCDNHLPSGSGFDSGTALDLTASRKDRLVFSTSFHHMNDGGMYDGWTSHDVIVKPDLAWGFDLRITGRDRRDIKEYIAEMFTEALRQEVTVD